MTRHMNLSRTENELLWFRRRETLQAAAAWVVAGGWSAAHAQQRSNIVELVGDVLLNGHRLLPQHTVQTGDLLETGPESRLVFVMGNASFHVRQRSRLTLERGNTLNTVSLVQLLAGAVASVWGQGDNQRIVTPTLTANIRGAGAYSEVFYAEQNERSYFCNCFGAVELITQHHRHISTSTHHAGAWASKSDAGVVITPALAINHTDDELEFLARLVNQRPPWYISGADGAQHRYMRSQSLVN